MADNLTVLDSAEVEKTVATKDIGSGVHASKVLIIDSTGNESTFIGTKLRTSSHPYLYDIALGNITNHTISQIHAIDTAIDTAKKTISNLSGVYVPPADAGEQLRVVSTSANDTSGGTGVQKVAIHYLDSSFAEQTETITLNGTTPVLTTATDIARVNYAHSGHSDVGSNGSAVGTITITNTGATTTYGQIDIGSNAIQQLFFTIPAGKKGFITSIDYTTYDKDVIYQIETTADNAGHYTGRGIYHHRHHASIRQGVFPVTFSGPLLCEALTDIMVTASSTDGPGVTVSCFLQGWYEDA